MLLFRFLLLELNTVFCHNSSSNHELFRHVVSKVFYSRMFLSTEGILLVSFPSKSYHFFCKCWELSKSTTFPFPKLSDKSELFTKHLCSFIRKKKSKIPHKTFFTDFFCRRAFHAFSCHTKKQSLRTVITLVAIKPYETMRVLLMALYTHFLTIYYSASVTTLINSIMHFT